MARDLLALRLRGDPRQGPAGRAAHPAVAAGDGALRGHRLRHLPLRPRPHQPLRQPRRRGALGDAAVRRRARHQPPLRRRARGGRLRRDPAGPDRPHRPLRRQGGGAARLPGGARADRGPRLRALLPRLRRRPGAAGRRPRARRPRPGRDRDPDLLDGGQLPRPRPARAARPAAPRRAADDRRDRRHRARCWPLGGPGYHRFGTWLAVLGLYDLVFLLVGYAVFDFLLED